MYNSQTFCLNFLFLREQWGIETRLASQAAQVYIVNGALFIWTQTEEDFDNFYRIKFDCEFWNITISIRICSRRPFYDPFRFTWRSRIRIRKGILGKYDGKKRIRFCQLIISLRGEFLWKSKRTCIFYKRRGISCLPEPLPGSNKGFYSVQLFPE